MLKLFDEHWPFVVAVIHGEVTEQDILEMDKTYRMFHQRQERFFLVQETRGVAMPGPRIISKLARLNERFAEDIRKNVIGVGVVVSSKVYSRVLSTLFYITRAVTPFFSSVSAQQVFEKAETFCLLEDIELPPGARAFMIENDERIESGAGFGEFFEQ